MKYPPNYLLNSFIEVLQQQPFEDYCFGLSALLQLLQMPQYADFFAAKLDPDFGRQGGYDRLHQLKIWSLLWKRHQCPRSADFETQLYYEELRLQDLLSLDLDNLFFCPKSQGPTDWLPLAQPGHTPEIYQAIQQAYDRSQLFLDTLAKALRELHRELDLAQEFLRLSALEQQLSLLGRIERVSAEMQSLYAALQELLKDLSLYLIRVRLKNNALEESELWIERFEERQDDLQQRCKQLFTAGGALLPFEPVFVEIERRYQVLQDLLDELD